MIPKMYMVVKVGKSYYGKDISDMNEEDIVHHIFEGIDVGSSVIIGESITDIEEDYRITVTMAPGA